MAEPLTVRCRALSAERDEPLAGTASRVQGWLAIEQPGAWGPDALHDSGLTARSAEAIEAAALAHRVRVLLIRRPRRGPGRSTATDVRRVYLAHSGRHGRWIEELDVAPHELAGLATLDLASLCRPDPPGIGRAGPASLQFVCTHGRHDPCCADFGRPVVHALVEAGTDHVWETSHIGGDRFAANLLCLPDGTYYGRVEPEGAARLVADHRLGLVDLDHYRGRSCLPAAAQVAEVHARELLGERRIDAIAVRSMAEHGGITTVRIERVGGTAIDVDVVREVGPAQQLTCHAAHPGRSTWYRPVALRTTDP